MNFVWPSGSTSKPYVSSAFGPRKAPIAGASTYHRGTDFSHTFSVIRAVADGIVSVAGKPNGWTNGGTQVWIQHDGFFTRSLHMSSIWSGIRAGVRVVAGQELGIMGRTGTATDTHLHFEVSPGKVHFSNSGQVDPVPFIANRVAAPAGGGTGAGEWDEMATEQQIKNAFVEVLTTHGAGPGDRGVFDSLKFIASLVDAKGNAVVSALGGKRVQDSVVDALTSWKPLPGGRNIYDFLIFMSQIQGSAVLTDEQAQAISERFAEISVTALETALADDFEGVKTRIAQLPAETIAALKSAL